MYRVSVEPSWWCTHESRCLLASGCSLVQANIPREGMVCLGSVGYCRMHSKWPACDPYPEWLPWGRKIYREGNPGEAFYKPTDVPKRIISQVRKCPPSGRWAASEIVQFVEEHRAYVLGGYPVALHPYDGTEKPYTRFPWAIPKKLTAAIDFGIAADGRVLPIEVNDPYAIGWYGPLTDYKIYTEFVLAGWEHMCSTHKEACPR